MATSAHLRLTGEAPSWLRLGILPPVRDDHTQVQAVLLEQTPLWTLVDWVYFQLDAVVVVPSRNVFRQTTMTRPPPHSQREIPREGRCPPIWREIDCPLEPVDADAWWPVHVREHKSARLLSLNVGPVGLKHSLHTLHHIVRANNPSVILLQDCRLRPNDEATMLQTLRERFVDFHPFIASGFRQRTNRTSRRMPGQMRNQRRYYPFSVAVMVHRTCGTAKVQSNTTPTSTRHAGRMLTVHVQPPSPLLPFQVTSYYSPVPCSRPSATDTPTPVIGGL
jgi:hypothetical protein